jgi:hypothetical protein
MKTISETEVLPPAQSNALATREPSSMVVSDPESILRYAIDRNANVDVIERMMAVRDKLKAEVAREAFDRALNNFQAECPPISKSRGVSDNSGKEAYRYAPIEDVEAVIRPIEQKFGFSHKFPKMVLGTGVVTAFCEIRHEGGHSESAEVTYRIGTRTKMMSDTQVDAATETFAKRRALCNGYGLVLVGEDKDGQGARPKPHGPSALETDTPDLKPLAQELWTLLKSIRGSAPNWNASNQWLWKEEITDGAIPEEAPHFTAARFREVIEKVKTKLQSKP